MLPRDQPAGLWPLVPVAESHAALPAAPSTIFDVHAREPHALQPVGACAGMKIKIHPKQLCIPN